MLLSSEKHSVASSKKTESALFVNGHYSNHFVHGLHNDTFENALAQGENDTNRFSHLLSIMPAGVLVIGQKGSVTLANQQAINLLGEPLVGQLWRDVISRTFSPKADDGHEVSMKNGKRVKIDISPMRGEKGQLIVVTDLTETRELQSRLGHMQRLSSLGKMVASLAHQVRTPLSSALLYAENLKSMELNNNTADKFANKLSLRLQELESQVNDMLLFAKSSDKQIVSQLSLVQICQYAFSQIEAQVKQANIVLQMELEKGNERVEVLGNLTAISGAITNLIANAMQALSEFINTLPTPEHQKFIPHITLQCQQQQIDGQHFVAFTVKDNGLGIEDDKLDRIFEPFFTTKSQGTGLGLAVVNTVAKSHKGHVQCGNNEQSGAYFSLLLPIANLKGLARDASNTHSDLEQQQGVHS